MYILVAIGTEKKIGYTRRNPDRDKLVQKAQGAFRKFINDCQDCKARYHTYSYDGYYEVRGMTEDDKPFYQSWQIYEVPNNLSIVDTYVRKGNNASYMLSSILEMLTPHLDVDEYEFINGLLRDVRYAIFEQEAINQKNKMRKNRGV